MIKHGRLLTALVATGVIAGIAIMSGATAAPNGGAEVELDEAEVFIEWNSTDTDFGIQFFWDGDPWDRMKVRMDGERAVLNVKIAGAVRDQGLTEGFFESAEPSADKLPMDEFLERFPIPNDSLPA